MKNKQIYYIIIIATTLIIQSCATAYIPNRVNSPMFKDKGEFKLDLTTGRNGFDTQAAYSPIKNVGIMLNGCFSDRDKDTLSESFHEHIYGEIGLGYYKLLADEKSVFEVYAGYGIGNTQTFYDWGTYIPNTKLKADFSKIFIQPAIGINNKALTVSFASRFSFIKMDIDRMNSQYFTINDFDLFWEPAFTLAVGKTVKFTTQIGGSFPIIPLPDGYPIIPRKFMFSLGLQLHLGRK